MNKKRLHDIETQIQELRQLVRSAKEADINSLFDQIDALISEKAIYIANSQNSIRGNNNTIGDNNTNTAFRIEGDFVFNSDHNIQANEIDALRVSYLDHVLQNSNRLYLAGIDPKAADEKKQMELCEIYTPLVTTSLLSNDINRTEIKDALTSLTLQHSTEKNQRNLSAIEELAAKKHLVILGDPGSGKSSFVNFVSACFAGAVLEHPRFNLELITQPLNASYLNENCSDYKSEDQPNLISQSWEHGSLIPVVMVLRDFATSPYIPAKGQRATAKHFWDFITHRLKQHTLEVFSDHLHHELQNKGGLLLLDGLDEIPNAEIHREHICEMVEDLASIFPKCRILVTSRTYAYQRQDWQIPNFETAILSPFNQLQINRFIDGWYNHVSQLHGITKEEATGRANQLKAAIDDSHRLLSLAENPLLLTLTASLHAWRQGSLPEKREELYSDAVDLMLHQWERQRIRKQQDGSEEIAQPSLEQWLKLDRDQVRDLLNRLAYEAHAKQEGLDGTADIAEADLVMGLIESSGEEIQPKQITIYLRDRAGLLISRGVKVYSFPHRTFQEYLAACHLTEDDFPAKVANLARADPTRWREVALLAGAKAARGTSYALWGLVDELAAGPMQTTDETELWGGHLAGQFIVETADYSRLTESQKEKVAKVTQRLVTIITDTTLPQNERLQAGINLGKLGDPRKTVTEINDIEFAHVPKGKFWMGASELDTGADEDEKPEHLLDIPYDYWVSRYPVTAAQFNQFTQSKAYEQEEWWAEAISAGTWESNQVIDYDGYRHSKLRFESLPNHPVRGVTWYEATAFCNWLTHQWRQSGWISDKTVVSLPSETEWEKSARGGLNIPQSKENPFVGVHQFHQLSTANKMIVNPNPKRLYPWESDLPLVELANFELSGHGEPSAVGCYVSGRSVYGCEELAGNIYEWTRSPFQNYRAVEPKKNKKSNQPNMAIRGFGYGSSARWLRCSARISNSRDSGRNFIGFRIVLLNKST